jgi:hypothetical protein
VKANGYAFVWLVATGRSLRVGREIACADLAEAYPVAFVRKKQIFLISCLPAGYRVRLTVWRALGIFALPNYQSKDNQPP